MVFWTIVFFTMCLISLIRGGLFKSYKQKMKELQLRKLDGEIDSKEWLKTGCFPLIVMTVLAIAQIVYIINALSYDPYKFPTIAALAMTIVVFVKVKKTKKTEEMTETDLIIYKAELIKEDKRTFISTVKTFLWVVYFGYMFYVLVF